LQANLDILDGRRPGTVTEGLRDLGDGVWVEGESVLLGGVVGPSAIFGGCEIAAGARVTRSVIGAGSLVDAGATVTDSVLMEGTHVAASASVSSSILGPQSTVGQRSDVRAVSVLGTRAVVASGTVVDGERIAG